MRDRRTQEIGTLYATGLLQGLALVAFPAASSIFTNPHYFDMSYTAYGSLFIPQAITSIAGSLGSSALAKKGRLRSSLLLGLFCNLLSMLLLTAAAFSVHAPSNAYILLLFSTACLGLGFGMTVPALNTFVTRYFPQKMDLAVLILNALLGLGTALAPVLIVLFLDMGHWWGLPVALLAAFLLMYLVSLTLPFHLHSQDTPDNAVIHQPLPLQFWLFAAFALLYGVVETINGNWAPLYMKHQMSADTSTANMALAAFWTMCTLGRVFFGCIEKAFSATQAFRLLPCLLAIAFCVVTFLPMHRPLLGVIAFGFTGLGCSALLPLIISLGCKQLPSLASSLAGYLIAFYLLGYGLAAFGVGPLKEWLGWNLTAIFIGGILFSAILALMAYFITYRFNEGDLT